MSADTDLLPKNSLVHNWKNRLYHPWLGGAVSHEGIKVFGRLEGVHHPAG